MLRRRGLLQAIGLCAPAIVLTSGLLMPIKPNLAEGFWCGGGGWAPDDLLAYRRRVIRNRQDVATAALNGDCEWLDRLEKPAREIYSRYRRETEDWEKLAGLPVEARIRAMEAIT